jgi:hypothetical protein
VIGAQGQIGGTSWEGATLLSRLVPIMWRTPTSAPTRLPLPDGYGAGRVVGVGTDGTLAGTVMAGNSVPVSSSSTWRAIVWRPDGSYRLLPAPAGLAEVKSTRAVSMRDNKIVVAVTAIDGSGGRVEIPYVYDIGTGLYARIPNLELRTSYSPDVDPADGAPVRAGNVNGGLLLLGRGDVVYTPNAGLTHLPITGTPAAYHEATPTTINDTSTVIGGFDQTLSHGTGAPVYWSCG